MGITTCRGVWRERARRAWREDALTPFVWRGGGRGRTARHGWPAGGGRERGETRAVRDRGE